MPLEFSNDIILVIIDLFDDYATSISPSEFVESVAKSSSSNPRVGVSIPQLNEQVVNILLCMLAQSVSLANCEWTILDFTFDFDDGFGPKGSR